MLLISRYLVGAFFDQISVSKMHHITLFPEDFCNTSLAEGV